MNWLLDVSIIVLMFLFDSIWIGSNIKMYEKSVRTIQGSKMEVSTFSAGITYLIMYIAIKFIAVPLALKDNQYKTFLGCLKTAGLVGFCSYGIYNFTNKAILKGYSWEVAIKDTLWGTFLFTIVVYIVMNYVYSK